jgi:Putative esterase
VQTVTIYSTVLGVNKTFYVYLPPDYESAERQWERYPVLYLFRGHEREWVNPAEDGSRGGKNVVDVYLRLYRAGVIGRMLLVMPGTTSEDSRIPGLLVNFKQPELARQHRGVGTGRYESFFIKELVTYVDYHFRTLPQRQFRGVSGFSLGGFQAVKIALQYPELFATAGAYDGTFLYASKSGKSISEKDGVFRMPIFDPAFGRPRDSAHVVANNPANLIIKTPVETLDKIYWMLQAGPETAEPWDSNFYRTRYLCELLAKKGISNRVPMVIPDGRHNWHTADRHMEMILPHHWRALSAAFTNV